MAGRTRNLASAPRHNDPAAQLIRHRRSKDETHCVNTNDDFRWFDTMGATHAIDDGPENNWILFQDWRNVSKIDTGSRKVSDFEDKLTDGFVKVKFVLHRVVSKVIGYPITSLIVGLQDHNFTVANMISS